MQDAEIDKLLNINIYIISNPFFVVLDKDHSLRSGRLLLNILLMDGRFEEMIGSRSISSLHRAKVNTKGIMRI